MMERHVSDVRILFLGLDPTVAEAFQHIDEPRCIVNLTLIGTQLDRKLVLVVTKRELTTLVESLFEDDTTVELLANANLLSEELQATEDGLLRIVDT